MSHSPSLTQAMLEILEFGAPQTTSARHNHTNSVIPYAEKGWHSSWHDRMDDEEAEYDEDAFGSGEPLDFDPGA